VHAAVPHGGQGEGVAAAEVAGSLEGAGAGIGVGVRSGDLDAVFTWQLYVLRDCAATERMLARVAALAQTR
jgi:hypothetical protein